MVENNFGTAVILAGGKSSRMGFNKEFLTIDGESLIEKNIRKLKSVFNHLIVVTNNPEYYSELHVETVRDIYFQRGPLSGIHVGLKNAKSKYVYLFACDMPEIDIDFVKVMMQVIEKGSNAEIYVVKHEDWIEPFGGFYSRELVGKVENLIEKNRLSINALIKSSNTEYLDIKKSDIKSDIFLNLNTQEELREYREKKEKFDFGCYSKKRDFKDKKRR